MPINDEGNKVFSPAVTKALEDHKKRVADAALKKEKEAQEKSLSRHARWWRGFKKFIRDARDGDY